MCTHSDYNTTKEKYSSLKISQEDKSFFKVIMMIMDFKELDKNC